MREEAGFIIDEVLKDCRKQTDDLKKEKDRLNQHKYNIDVKKRENDWLRKDANAAKREFAETLQEELNGQSESDDETEQEGTEINTARLIMQFLKEEKIPELKTGSRVVKEEPAVYVEELKNLTKQNRDKYHDLAKLVDKVHKATAAEEAAVKGFNDNINNQEENYGSLIDRVNKIEHRCKVLAAL